MRLKKGKKALALLLTALMVVGLIPIAGFGPKTAKAAGEAKTYSLNANDQTATSGLAESITSGESNYFTLNKGVKVTANTKTVADKDFTQRMQTAGAGKATEKSISFTTGGAATVTIYAATSGGNAGEVRHVVMKSAADDKLLATSPDMAKGEANATAKFDFDITEAGTYYLTADVGGIDIYYVEVAEKAAAAEPVEAELNANDQTVTSGLAESITSGTNSYFTLNKGVKVTANTKTVEDKDFTQRMQTAGAGSATEKSISFTTGGAATVTIYAATSGGNAGEVRHVVMKSAADNKLLATSPDMAKGEANATAKFDFDITEAGTYYLTADVGGIDIYYVKVVEAGGAAPVVRKPWAEVAAPAIGTITAANGTITVPYTMEIGNDGADTVTIAMKDSAGKETSFKGYVTDGTATFKPSASGDYTFSISAQRKDETDKTGTDVTFTGFVYPLGKSTIGAGYSKGNGTFALEWSAVKEAESYAVEYSADGATWNKADAGTNLTADVTGLTVGTEYSFRIVTTRGQETTTSDIFKGTATAQAQQKWGFISYGNGASASKDSYTGSVDSSLTVKSGSGKIVPASFDGLAFYYTEVPASMNFTLRAKVKVDTWTVSNGQEGLGMMAADKLGGSGWNNSYMAEVTKVEYYWDAEKQEVTTDTSATKVTHKIGIGAQQKIGITKDNVDAIEGKLDATTPGASTDAIAKYFSTTQYPLEQRYPYSAGLIGNYNTTPDNPIENPITEMYLTIQKNNTGYFVTYESPDGSYTVTKKYYDPKALEHLDTEKVYVGFFAARNMTATFSDISFTTIDPKDDTPAEERPVEKIAVNASVSSPTAIGTADYAFKFAANCDGSLSILDASGKVLAENVAVKANETVSPFTAKLTKGKNAYKVVFTPDANYKPGEYMAMESYEPITINHTVTYKIYGQAGESLWVAPGATGLGSKDDPMSIYDAVKYVQAGQTIVLKGGTYNLDRTIKVERGIDGTADKKIYMVADPDAKERPVFDFGGNCAGMILAGDYWYFQGFDVTKSKNAQKGLLLSGSNCVLDNINAYYNGSTGIQLSRYLTTDDFENWPANNLVLNCTSYGNADIGYEDADGFAAKLTVGEGNVFDGCIAHHNADDGWDLFAKVQTGSIGSVTIRNSVAYANGYLEDGTNAGNGNGFKMGGDSMPGKHVLENSVAYDNKAKGIDSNSCPDIIVKNSITFNNGSNNVAFYTGNAANTDYSADDVISFRTKNLDQSENIKPKGTQSATSDKIYKDTNYYWDASNKVSANKSGDKVTEAWFVSTDTSIALTRNADGTINMNGLLELTDKAVITAGMSKGTASALISIPKSIVADPANAVNTGDTTPVALYVVLAVLSLAVLAGAVFYGKKRFTK